MQTKVPAILDGGVAYLTVYLGCGICTIAQLVLERTLSCCYLLVGIQNMSTAIIQSLGHSVPSMAVDLGRNYAVLIPFAWLLSLTAALTRYGSRCLLPKQFPRLWECF